MTGKQLVSYLKKSFFTGVFKTVVVTLSTIVLLPLIIQQVGMETYGLISLTMIFGGMVVFADFGIAKTVTLLIGKDNAKANLIVSNALIINCALLILIALIFMGLLYFNVPIFGDKLQITSALKNYIVLMGFLVLAIMLINNLLIAILESFYLMHYVNTGFTISSVLINIVIYLTSVMTDSIYLLLLAPVFSLLFVSLYFLTVIGRLTEIKLTRPSKQEMRNMLSVSYKFLNIGLINSFMIPVNKYLLIYVTGSSSALGVFDVGLKIALIANSLLNSIAQPLFGVFSNMNTNRVKIFEISSKISLVIFFLYLLGIVIYFNVGNQITNIIDSAHQSELFLVSMVLLLAIAFTSVAEPFYRAMLGRELLVEALYMKLLIPLLNVVFYFYFSHQSQLEQITLAYALAVFSSSLMVIIYYILYHKKQML